MTDNWGVIQQYFQLRHKIYQDEGNGRVKGLLGQGKLDFYDMRSKVFVAHRNGKCLGGARLVLVDGSSSQDLPLEGGLFSIKNYLPELNLQNCIYGESGRTAIDPDERNGEHTRELFKLTMDYCRYIGCKYIMGVAPLAQAKLYRMAYRYAGVHLDIRDDVVLPVKETDEGKRMYLIVGEIGTDTQGNTFSTKKAITNVINN